MPYIPDSDKQALLAGVPPQKAGELTYLITHEFVEAVKQDLVPMHAHIENHIGRYIQSKGKSFQTFAEIMGAICAAGLEWERREQPKLEPVVSVLSDVAADFYEQVVAPYEDQKITENGDVYP
jgi:hypothetical protein